MPELAELKLTADYINHVSKNRIFHGVRKNPVHKGKEVEVPYRAFTLNAQSRGKELLLTLKELNTENQLELLMTMGMSGYFQWIEQGVISKHSHLKFQCKEGSLDFVDIRRFGKWKLGYWSENRGPDPTLQFMAFVQNIKDNLHKKDFDKPICEVLMNQKWFNGIGNYLRAEILYRININPFTPAREALELAPEIYKLCQWAPMQAYKLGGGELKDWKNPFGPYKELMESWDDFIKCYNKTGMLKIEDRNGRTFWYDPKWQGQEYLAHI